MGSGGPLLGGSGGALLGGNGGGGFLGGNGGFLGSNSEFLRPEGLLSQARTIFDGLKYRVEDPSVLSQFASQLREIFSAPTNVTANSALEDASSTTTAAPSASTVTHLIRGVNFHSPFDLSELAGEEVEQETIEIDNGGAGVFPRLNNAVRGGFGLVGNVLTNQYRVATQKRRGDQRQFADAGDLPPRRRLQATTSLLNQVLGLPGRPGGLYGRFDQSESHRTTTEQRTQSRPQVESRTVAVEPSRTSGSSLLRQALHEEEETLSASRLMDRPNEDQDVEDYHQDVEGQDWGGHKQPRQQDKGSYLSSSQKAYQECFIPNAVVVGPEDIVVRSKDILHCQSLCQQNLRCRYCSFRFDEQLCYHYTDAERLQGTKAAISAPKRCAGVLDNSPVSSPVLSGQQSGSEDSTPSDRGIEESRKEEGLGGVLGLLGGGGASGLLTAATSMMTTGSQFMGAIPFKELAQAGLTLAENGYLRNRGMTRGLATRTKDKTQVPPPPGSGQPVVSCHAEGMTCCVPRTAVPDWQKHPPYLNSYKTAEECASIYVTTQDALCVTSVYNAETDRGRCGLRITDTTDWTMYRNILTVPSKVMNNALCECVHDHAEDPDTPPQGSARWEYSIAATEQAKKKLDQTEESATRLVKGAQAAQVLSQIFAGGNGGGGGGAAAAAKKGAAPSGLAAVGDMIGLASNLGSFVSHRRASRASE